MAQSSAVTIRKATPEELKAVGHVPATPTGSLTDPATYGLSGPPTLPTTSPRATPPPDIDDAVQSVAGGLRPELTSPIDRVMPSSDKLIRGAEVAIPAATTIAGGTFGARSGPTGAIAGAGLGSEAGELLTLGLRGATGVHPPTRDEVFEKLISAPSTGMTAEASGQLFTKLLAPFAGQVTDIAKQAQERFGDVWTPAQMTGNRILSGIENVAEQGLISSRKYKQFLGAQTSRIKQELSDMLGQFGPPTTREQAGRAVQSSITGTRDAQLGTLRNAFGPAQPIEQTGTLLQDAVEHAHGQAREIANDAYQAVDRMSQGTTVSLDGFRQTIEKELEKRGALAMAIGGGRGNATIKIGEKLLPEELSAPPGMEYIQNLQNQSGAKNEFLSKLADALADAGISTADADAGQLTFSQAHQLRSSLGKLQRQASQSGDSTTFGIVTQLRKSIDSAMTTAAGGTGSPLRTAYDNASALWKDMAQSFEEGALDAVSSSHPVEAIDKLIRDGRVADISLAKRKLGESSPAWQAVQSRVWNDLLSDGSTPLTGKQLAARLDKLTPETTRAIFGDAFQVNAANLIDPAKSSALAQFKSLIAPGSESAVTKMRDLVGPDVWEKVQSAHLSDLLKGPGDDVVSGAKLLDRLHRLTPATLRAAYPRGTADDLWQVARTLKAMQSARGGTGKVAIQLAQGGATIGLLSGGLTKAAAGVLLTPLMLGRVLTNPAARRWLTVGLDAAKSQNVKLGIRAGNELLAFLGREALLPSMRPDPLKDGETTTIGGVSDFMAPPPSGSGNTLSPPPAPASINRVVIHRAGG